MLEETRAEPRLVAELEDYGVIKGEKRDGVQVLRRDRARDRPRRRPSSPATASAGATCGCSARRPTARPRCFSRSWPPALRSRNAERRKEAIEALENLAAVTTHLKHLLLIRDLRKIVG